MSPEIQTLSDWLKATPKEDQAVLPIYQTQRPRFRPERMEELARLLGISGDGGGRVPDLEQRNGVHLLLRGDKVLALYEKSGAFSYADQGKLGRADYRPELPSLDAAVEIAGAYLKERDLLPENAVLDGAKDGTFELAQGNEHAEHSRVASHIAVDYRLEFGELPSYGPGAKIKVYLGHRGEVIGLLHAARAAQRYAEFRRVSRDALTSILSRKLGIPLDRVEVHAVHEAPFAESFAIDSRFVQPVYVFELGSTIVTSRSERPVRVRFLTHPIPATDFGPQVMIEPSRGPRRTTSGQPFRLTCEIQGGTKPHRVSWFSNIDGHLSDEPVLDTSKLSVAHRQNRISAHTIQVVVTDANGLQDAHQTLVEVLPPQESPRPAVPEPPAPEANDPYVGVEWCNLYHGSAPDISGTAESAEGFKNGLSGLPGWSSRFDWGNDDAWEEDFKTAAAPGGGTDSYWSDNVHFAFFAGHGSSGAFYFGSTVDDHQMTAADARWGDGLLNWIVLHACNTMMNNFAWTVWCDAFVGLHQMFGFHTTTEGSTPPLGARFALWSSWRLLPWFTGFDLQTAWRIACSECFDSSVEYSVIYANQAGTSTQSDHLTGFGFVSPDPTDPNVWCFYKGSC